MDQKDGHNNDEDGNDNDIPLEFSDDTRICYF